MEEKFELYVDWQLITETNDIYIALGLLLALYNTLEIQFGIHNRCVSLLFGIVFEDSSKLTKGLRTLIKSWNYTIQSKPKNVDDNWNINETGSQIRATTAQDEYQRHYEILLTTTPVPQSEISDTDSLLDETPPLFIGQNVGTEETVQINNDNQSVYQTPSVLTSKNDQSNPLGLQNTRETLGEKENTKPEQKTTRKRRLNASIKRSEQSTSLRATRAREGV
ncbi:unnamed protein product [Didymodactylos carnosus]|uniref:Uncharacterized protein n=1 Tax=Didymodactylos carnosus TaxID=1234261 RepID=A0A814AJR4_9BILA|nr:unnamed protein product [Didymodactylos carnosus]CAF3695901.1 unnamed protein product [Didymodactylos carnosus]